MKSYSHQFKPIAALIGCANCKSVMRRERERETNRQTETRQRGRETVGLNQQVRLLSSDEYQIPAHLLLPSGNTQ